jgi:hypothetical protein
MPDSFAITATALQSIIETEFSDEGFKVQFDRLHESLGLNRVDIGVSPEEWYARGGDRNTKDTVVLVQFYDLWDKKVDPEQTVNPTRITGFADRFERAVQRQQIDFPGSTDVWYLNVDRVAFPNDPTGNKTRFHATVRATGDNHAILETMA